jgi:hypothetical protein
VNTLGQLDERALRRFPKDSGAKVLNARILITQIPSTTEENWSMLRESTVQLSPGKRFRGGDVPDADAECPERGQLPEPDQAVADIRIVREIEKRHIASPVQRRPKDRSVLLGQRADTLEIAAVVMARHGRAQAGEATASAYSAIGKYLLFTTW